MARPVLPRTPVLRPPVGQHCAGQRADMLGLVDRLHLREFGQLLQRRAERRRVSICRIENCIQTSAVDDERNSSMKQLVQRPVRSTERAEGDRQHETAEAADHADQPADRADMFG